MVHKTHPYRRGYSFERRVRAHLEKDGWFVVRQGKSAFPDLICLKKGKAMLVECKVDGYLRPEERRRLLEVSIKTGAESVIASREGKKIALRNLMKEGVAAHNAQIK